MAHSRALSRRQFLQISGTATAGVLLAACVAPEVPATGADEAGMTIE